jgi:hypothetical protein
MDTPAPLGNALMDRPSFKHRVIGIVLRSRHIYESHETQLPQIELSSYYYGLQKDQQRKSLMEIIENAMP